MNEIKLSVQLVNALLQYLGTRPYQEVFPLIAEIQQQASPQVQQDAPIEAGGTD